jgi:Tol biopolymer transport system component
VAQGQGLPSLRHLDWGFAAIHHPVWSPDGRWIAVLAGDDYAGAHVEVVSPDGQTKYDLSSWRCGEGSDPDFAWLPDGRLSCINGDTPYPRMCIGAAPFSSCTAVHLSQVITGSQWGLTWAPNGQAALFAARPNDGSGANTELYVVTPAGVVQQELTSADQYDAAAPSFRPHAAQLAYYRGASVDSGGYDHFDLVISPFSQDATGTLTLGSARTIATEQHPDMSLYAWSPSGRWLAVRYADYQGGDRIFLVNPDNPSQTLDVVRAELAQQQMSDPIWSPDGKTLIVFGVNDQQPYAIDVASYLKSKGLQP